MYYCNDCGREFPRAAQFKESHGLASPPYEKISCCPFCGGGDIKEVQPSYCKCCGAKIESGNEYCSKKCRAKSEELRQRELKRRNRIYNSALYEAMRRTDEYNKKHGTNYSYGQFVGYIEPTLGRKRK